MTAPTTARQRALPQDFAALTAADIMQRDLITVLVSDPAHQIERVLADAKISGVPVLDHDDRLVGVVSMADLVRRYAEEQDLPADSDYPAFGDDVDETEIVAFDRETTLEACAGDLMTSEVTTVGPDTGLRELARIMVDQRIHRVLVTERSRVLGLVSTLDVLRAIAV
ncbi:MAG: CBS domain-containing protein [Planctomycetes bacterium]|nr:CBS domain-containing protein [Planctomycetota bacterium]MCB9887234.1 CBS domain-containing protein [Planctomycetota bacterium]